jgi:hypothetical protein
MSPAFRSTSIFPYSFRKVGKAAVLIQTMRSSCSFNCSIKYSKGEQVEEKTYGKLLKIYDEEGICNIGIIFHVKSHFYMYSMINGFNSYTLSV